MTPSTLEPLLLRILRRKGGPFDAMADPFAPGFQTALAGARYLVACLADPRDREAESLLDAALEARGRCVMRNEREVPCV